MDDIETLKKLLDEIAVFREYAQDLQNPIFRITIKLRIIEIQKKLEDLEERDKISQERLQL